MNSDQNKIEAAPGKSEPEWIAAQLNIPGWAKKVNQWRRKLMSEFVFLVWLSVIIGLIGGFGAHIFNRLIAIVTDIFTNLIKADALNWWLIPLPIAGILLAGIYTRYIIHTDLTHCTARLMNSIYQGKFKIKPNIIYSPIIGGVITLGLGGSAGSEGPIAYSGAAIGSNIGRILGLQPQMLKVLIGCGAAAGISGIFMSPMGGLLFALEFLRMEIGTLAILAATLSSFVAYGIVFICNGCVPAATFTPDHALDPSHYWAVLGLGLFCGFYSLYYSSAINRCDTVFTRIKNPWIRNSAGGLVVGISIFLFPALFGVGYPVASATIHHHFQALSEGNILNGIDMGPWTLIIITSCILIIKCWACGACNASGGVSSDFAPTMYAGAIAGFLFSTFFNHVFETHLPVGIFTFLGMAGVMAGAIEAPLMSIFIVLNMGMEFEFALPIGLCVFTSYIIVKVCSQLRGYDSKMAKHLHWFHGKAKRKEPPLESDSSFS